jgi:hypothetical protein
MPLERNLAEVFGAFGDAMKNDLYKARPAIVTAVHASRQTVDVQIATDNIIFDDLGQTYVDPAASFVDVPLGVMRGGGFIVWVPVAVGDSVLLIFTDLSTDTWRAGDGNPRPPGWAGKHTADSAFAVPMIAPDRNMLASADPSKMVIGKDGSSALIKLSATDIELGGVSDAVALASKVDLVNAALKAFMIATTAYVTGIKTIADPTDHFTSTMLTAITAMQNATLPPTGSLIVKAV